uniref:Uncharacterized protein n=1 Tax=Arundo donax TaxID=35708 RepID=A0A0A9AWT0_ARUDO
MNFAVTSRFLQASRKMTIGFCIR